MSKELKAVFIDWNGTLSTSNFWEHLEHQDPATYNKIQSTLFTGGLAYLIEPWMVGEHYTEDIIRNLARNTGIEEHKLYYEFVYACKTMQLVSPDILSLVSQLRSR